MVSMSNSSDTMGRAGSGRKWIFCQTSAAAAIGLKIPGSSTLCVLFVRRRQSAPLNQGKLPALQSHFRKDPLRKLLAAMYVTA